jgi:PAS domain S-box-containing protein
MITMAVDITERRQIEEQLEENELKFSIIFDKAPFAAALSKLPEGVVSHVNEEFEQVFGYTRQEVLGRTSLEMGIHPDPEARESILAQIQAHGSARNVETRLYTKSGDIRMCLVNLDEVSIGGQKYILQTAQDITERKRGEKALRDSEERFSKAFHKSPFGMNITRWRDGAILDVNDAWLNLLGWTREEILGRTTAEFPFYARPEDRTWVRERITKDEVSGDMELHLVRKDGAELVVDVATTIIDVQGERCILGVLNDITERKQAENALRQSEERFAKAFHSSPDAIIISRLSDGLILEVNEGWHELTGYEPGEVFGRTTIELGIWVNVVDRSEIVSRLKKTNRFGILNCRFAHSLAKFDR